MNTERHRFVTRYRVTDGNRYFPLSAIRARVRGEYTDNSYHPLPVTSVHMIPMSPCLRGCGIGVAARAFALGGLWAGWLS